jgi:C4-type Zn-finger protein
MNEKLKDILARHAKWDTPVQRLFQQPDHLEGCPFCGQKAVKASWAMFSNKGEERLASLDVCCEVCGERMHGVYVLPEKVPDSYPPGVVKYEAEMTKRLFKTGQDKEWW